MFTTVSQFPLDYLRILTMPEPAEPGSQWTESQFQLATIVAIRDGLTWTQNQFRKAARWSGTRVRNQLQKWGLVVQPRVGGFTKPEPERQQSDNEAPTKRQQESVDTNALTTTERQQSDNEAPTKRQQNPDADLHTSGNAVNNSSSSSAPAHAVKSKSKPIKQNWRPSAEVWADCEKMPGVKPERLSMVLAKFVNHYADKRLPNPNGLFVKWVTWEINHKNGVFQDPPKRKTKAASVSQQKPKNRKNNEPYRAGVCRDSGDIETGREIWAKTLEHIRPLVAPAMMACLEKGHPRLEKQELIVYLVSGTYDRPYQEVTENVWACNNQIPEFMASLRAEYDLPHLTFDTIGVYELSEVRYGDDT